MRILVKKIDCKRTQMNRKKIKKFQKFIGEFYYLILENVDELQDSERSRRYNLNGGSFNR